MALLRTTQQQTASINFYATAMNLITGRMHLFVVPINDYLLRFAICFILGCTVICFLRPGNHTEALSYCPDTHKTLYNTYTGHYSGAIDY